jgi:hypothetical protein
MLWSFVIFFVLLGSMFWIAGSLAPYRGSVFGLLCAIVIFAFATIILCPLPAFAQTAVTSGVVPVAPWVQFISPYVNIIVPPIVTALVGLVLVKVQQWTHVRLSASAVASLKSAAATQAGMLVASAEDNLANQSIKVDDARVVAAASQIAALLPDAAAFVGASPQGLQRIVLGEIGKLQAQATVVPVPAAKA